MLKSTWGKLKSVGQAAWGVMDSLPLVVFKSHGDGVLRYMVSGHGGDGLGLDLVISVVFSTLIIFGLVSGGIKQE